MCELPTGYAARPATLDDVDAMAALFNGIAAGISAADTMAATSFRTLLSTPEFDIAASTRLVHASDGTLAGFVELFDFEEPFTRIWGHALTAIEHRGRGVEEALHAWILERTKSTVAKAAPDVRVFIEQTVSAKDTQAIDTLREFGYEHTRTYLHMSIDLSSEIPAPDWPDGFTVCPIRSDEDLDGFLRAMVEAFSDHYGRGEMSSDQQVEFLRHLTLANPSYDPSLYFSIRQVDEVVGICNAYPQDGIHTDSGYIPAVAVRRPWRRRGLALAMLLHQFRELKIRGKTAVVLHVDGESTTGANRLYEKAGMHVDDRNLEFQLTLRPGRA